MKLIDQTFSVLSCFLPKRKNNSGRNLECNQRKIRNTAWFEGRKGHLENGKHVFGFLRMCVHMHVHVWVRKRAGANSLIGIKREQCCGYWLLGELGLHKRCWETVFALSQAAPCPANLVPLKPMWTGCGSIILVVGVAGLKTIHCRFFFRLRRNQGKGVSEAGGDH